MAAIEILSETDVDGGWQFEIQARDSTGGLHRHRLDLSWADYNLWSATGSDEPSAVATAVIRFLHESGATDGLRHRFDAALARRLRPDADTAIPALIGAAE